MQEWRDALRTPTKPPHFEPLVASLRKSNAEIAAEKERVQFERDAAETAADELRHRLAEMQDKQQHLESRAVQAETEATRTSLDAVELAGVKLENEILRAKLKTAEADCTDLAAQLAAARLEAFEAREKLAQAETDSTEMQNDLLAQEQVRRELRLQVDRAREANEALGEMSRMEFSRLQQEMVALKARAERAEMAQQLAENVVKSRAVRLMGHRALVHHWRAWSRLADQHRKVLRTQRTLRHAVAKITSGKIALSFGNWMNACREVRRCGKIQDTLMRTAARLRNRNLGQGWTMWVSAWQEAASLGRSARASVNRWLNQRLTRGWGSWVEMVDEANALRNAARAVIKRWLSQSLTHALCVWIEMVAARHEAMRNLRHAAAKMVYRQLALGFSSWVHAHLTALKGQREMRSHHLQHHAEVAQRQLEVNAINTILLAELSQADEQLYEARSRAMTWKIRACTPGAGLQDAYRSRDFHPPPPISTPSPGEVIINRLPGQSKLNPTPLRKSPATPKSAYEKALAKSPLAKAGRHVEDHEFERWPETPARMRWEDQM